MSRDTRACDQPVLGQPEMSERTCWEGELWGGEERGGRGGEERGEGQEVESAGQTERKTGCFFLSPRASTRTLKGESCAACPKILGTFGSIL